MCNEVQPHLCRAADNLFSARSITRICRQMAWPSDNDNTLINILILIFTNFTIKLFTFSKRSFFSISTQILKAKVIMIQRSQGQRSSPTSLYFILIKTHNETSKLVYITWVERFLDTNDSSHKAGRQQLLTKGVDCPNASLMAQPDPHEEPIVKRGEAATDFAFGFTSFRILPSVEYIEGIRSILAS